MKSGILFRTLYNKKNLDLRCQNLIIKNSYDTHQRIDSIIPVTASTPWGYKMSAFNSFIKKAHIVCSDEFLEDELNHIVKIGIDHGYYDTYKPHIIHKLIEKFNTYPQSAQLTRPSYRKIMYIPAMFERLRRIFNRFRILLVASPSENLFLAIIKKQDPLPILYHSGVYEIPMHLNTGLLTSYIGMPVSKN